MRRPRTDLAACLVTATLACASAPRRANAQAPAVGIGYGVDTADADVGPIVHLLRAYLAAPDSALARHLWQMTDPTDQTQRDLAARYALQGAPASIVAVLSTGAGDSVYVVKLLYARAEHANEPVSPVALERLYAVRAPRSPIGWQLSAALPRLTRQWQTRTSGRIAFHYAPGQSSNARRMTAANAFVDSVARLFGVTPPSRIDYYVTASPDEYYRALGLDFFVLPSGRGQATGGNALPDADIVLAGDPAQGELHRHELVHVALGSRIKSGFVAEGAAAWLGGSHGEPASSLFKKLVAFQLAHPELTFSRIINDKLSVPHDPVASADAWYASAALVCDAVYRRGGTPGLQTLADARNTTADVEGVVAGLLDIQDDPASLDRWWRAAAQKAATTSRPRRYSRLMR